MTTSLRVSLFPGGFNWPLFAGMVLGFFEREGLVLELVPTRGSVAQMTDFAAGHFEIAMTAVDNIVAYVDGQGEAPIGAQPEFFAFLGSDDSFLSLTAAAEVRGYADLRGRAVSVDAATTGYAFVLFEMLRQAGLEPGSYGVVRVGGMTERWQDLRQGGHVATMLSTPYEVVAQREGFRVLGRASDVVRPYQGNVAAARLSWAAAHRAELVGFVRGYVEAIAWLGDTANRHAACDILVRNVPGMTEELVQDSAGVLLDEQTGFFRDGRVKLDGIATVLDLRARYHPLGAGGSDPMRYVDFSFWEAART